MIIRADKCKSPTLFLTAREGAKILQVSIPTFYRRIADGTLPKPIKMGSLSRWAQSEINAAIEDAKAKRHAV